MHVDDARTHARTHMHTRQHNPTSSGVSLPVSLNVDTCRTERGQTQKVKRLGRISRHISCNSNGQSLSCRQLVQPQTTPRTWDTELRFSASRRLALLTAMMACRARPGRKSGGVAMFFWDSMLIISARPEVGSVILFIQAAAETNP